MTDFLTPTPSIMDIRFDSPRTNSVSGSGLLVASHRFQALWRGNLRFAPTTRGATNPMLAVARADLVGEGFFVDLAEADSIPIDSAGRALPPTWHEARGNSNTQQVGLQATHTAVAGDLISFRQSALPQFVTARRILSFETDSGGVAHAQLDAVLPEEFFPLAPNTVLQYSYDRPHCRARFTEPPQRWRKSNPTYAQPNNMDWVEDTAASVLALRSLSGSTGVETDDLLDQNGEPLLDQNGNPLKAQ